MRNHPSVPPRSPLPPKALVVEISTSIVVAIVVVVVVVVAVVSC